MPARDMSAAATFSAKPRRVSGVMWEVFSSIGWIHMKRKALGHVMHPSALNALLCGRETSAEPKRVMNDESFIRIKNNDKTRNKDGFFTVILE